MSENCRKMDWPHRRKQFGLFRRFYASKSRETEVVKLLQALVRFVITRGHDRPSHLSTKQAMPSSMSGTDDLPSLLWITYVSRNIFSPCHSLTWRLSIPPVILLSAYFVRKWYLARRLKLYGIGKGGELLSCHFYSWMTKAGFSPGFPNERTESTRHSRNRSTHP